MGRKRVKVTCLFCRRTRPDEESLWCHYRFWHDLSDSDAVRAVAFPLSSYWIGRRVSMDERSGILTQFPLL